MTVPVVGALLIFTLMIGPPAAARCVTDRPGAAWWARWPSPWPRCGRRSPAPSRQLAGRVLGRDVERGVLRSGPDVRGLVAVPVRPAGAGHLVNERDSPLDPVSITRALEAAGCVAAAEEADELIRAAPDERGLRLMVDRRLTGEPLTWITGTAVFCGQTIAVDPGVYVPRWQSEPLAGRSRATPAGWVRGGSVHRLGSHRRGRCSRCGLMPGWWPPNSTPSPPGVPGTTA